MTDNHAVHLSDRTILKLTGPDATVFLQNIITNDMADLHMHHALYAGILSPQGKILFDFLIARTKDAFLIDVARSLAPALLQRLNMYKLRSDVTIVDIPNELCVLATWSDEKDLPETSDAILATYPDPRLADLGYRQIAIATHAQNCTGDSERYHAHRIGLGVPEGGYDFAYGNTFPHEALFDQIHGVSFSKGCYVGQEVVSRMHHRHSARKRIVTIKGPTDLPDSGTEIIAGKATLGQLGSKHDHMGLALLRIDRVQEAIETGQAIVCGDVHVDVSIQPWANFSLLDPSGRKQETA